MKKLTKKQNDILNYIIEYKMACQISPNHREIASNFGITPKGAYDHVRAIEKKGYIKTQKNIPRSIIVKNETKLDTELFYFISFLNDYFELGLDSEKIIDKYKEVNKWQD